MTKSTNKTIKRIGKVSIQIQRDSLRLRFTHSQKTYSLTVGSNSKENLKAAIARAKEIDADIAWMRFDSSLVKYRAITPKREENVLECEKSPTEITIKQIWENYLKIKGDSSAASTQRVSHAPIDKWIRHIPEEKLGISYLDEHVAILKGMYGKVSISTMFRTFKAACNLAVKTKLIEYNPYAVYDQIFITVTKGERSRKPFEPHEVELILAAFKTDRFVTRKFNKHSYYYPFVRFLALTGCRPEDAIALTQSDLFESQGREVIRFSKAYCDDELKETKTGTIRMFPINRELKECLELAPIHNNQKGLNLVFPSEDGGYINLHTFTSRIFKVVVKNLYLKGEIKNQLPTYHLRHTFITQMIRKGIDIATIANLVGNSSETILNNYLGANQGIELPELFKDS